MSLIATLGDFFNGFDGKVKELVKLCIFCVSDSLDYIATNGANSTLIELFCSLAQVGDGDTACEDRCSRILNGKVGEALAKELVCCTDAHEAVIDENVTSHHLVD